MNMFNQFYLHSKHRHDYTGLSSYILCFVDRASPCIRLKKYQFDAQFILQFIVLLIMDGKGVRNI